MICPKCRRAMKTKMHFEQGRQYQYNECSNCYERTKNKRIHFEEILKEEVK